MGIDIVKGEIIRKGAEANLFLGSWFDEDVIFKQRSPKNYRIEQLDKRIRTKRTLNEARALIRVKEYGINVPHVYEIDTESSTIIMKYIHGEKLKDVLDRLSFEERKRIFIKIGQYIAILHIKGHIHGDITTSNVILTKQEQVFLIDFGLHTYSDSIEDKSVDLHLFKRVLISSHGSEQESCFKFFLEGYCSEYGKYNNSECDSIIKNISIIETRGRYVKKEDRL